MQNQRPPHQHHQMSQEQPEDHDDGTVTKQSRHREHQDRRQSYRKAGQCGPGCRN